MSSAYVVCGRTSSYQVRRCGPSFFLSFFHPSDETLKLLTRVIEQHLQRSENLSLALYVCLEDKYNHSLSRAIASLLKIHRRRWREVHIWFETKHREFGEFEASGAFAGSNLNPFPFRKCSYSSRTSCRSRNSAFPSVLNISSHPTPVALFATPCHLSHASICTLCTSTWKQCAGLTSAPTSRMYISNGAPDYSSDYATHPPYSAIVRVCDSPTTHGHIFVSSVSPK